MNEDSDSIDPDDCFPMVTPVQVEDEVMWNGDDIKHKVFAKLNEKYYPACWIPSGVHRTASAFT